MGKTSLNLEENVASLLCYLGGWITGLVFYLIEKDNKVVRFHAMQSMLTFGGLTAISIVLGFIPVIGLITLPLWILGTILWIVLMVKAYKGEYFKLPFVGDIAEKNS